MAASSLNEDEQSHIAVCPGAAMAHLTPFLRLASKLSSKASFKLTLVIIRPTLSASEDEDIAAFLSTHPQVHLSEFQSLPCDDDPSLSPNNTDPFLLRYAALCRAANRLVDHLISLSPRPTAVISDIMLASGLNKPLAEHSVLNFNFITNSARWFSFLACMPLLQNDGEKLEQLFDPIEDDIIGGPVMFIPAVKILKLFYTNYKCIGQARGIILNTFDFLEPKTIKGLHSGGIDEALGYLPPVFPLGPLHPIKAENGTDESYLSWLDNQPLNSVLFIAFGSRTAISKEQAAEIAKGLENSGVGFFWVIKTAIVDKEDTEELSSFFGDGFLERTKGKGMVWKGWVSQDKILAHPSVGGFVTHSGWTSITEAALYGVPMIALPTQDEQRINACAMVNAGLGIWGTMWGSTRELVKGDELAEWIKELFTSERLQESARKIREEAKKAWEADGSSSQMLERFINIID